MAFYDDLVANCHAEPGAFTDRLGGKKRVQHAALHMVRNADAVVAEMDLDAIAVDDLSPQGNLRRPDG